MIEILWKDKVHYTRPDDHQDVEEAKALIQEQNMLYGSSLYSIRAVQ
jgi:hypothetical protein